MNNVAVTASRIAKCQTTNVKQSNFKSVMLASLLSLVRDLGSTHEVAWSWRWENAESMLRALMGSLPFKRVHWQLSRAPWTTRPSLFSREFHARILVLALAVQDFFKQSTTRLY